MGKPTKEIAIAKTPVKNNGSSLVNIHSEVTRELASPEVMKSLVATTFKGLSENSVKQAITEGMMRGFKFKDFLEKNVYAVPFGSGQNASYSLITSIDYARKIAMRSGVVGKSAPVYTEDATGKIVSCSITIKRSINNVIGEWTSKVYFSEYYSGNKNPDGSIKSTQYGPKKETLWDSKPRTMIAKVAEMHALRMACPEELSQAYVEEEIIHEAVTTEINFDVTPFREKLEAVKTIQELKTVWSALPIQAKNALETIKNELKDILAPVTQSEPEVLSAEEEDNIGA